MAFTKSLIAETVWGNKRVQLALVTADAAAGTVDFGSKRIEWAQVAAKSQASFINSGSTVNIPRLAYNAGATGTSTTGTLGMTSCIANDVYTVHVVFGEA